MDIPQTTAAAAATTKRPAAAEAGAAAGETAAETAADFQTFLKLLTTQLKNQDPLKPMESTEFVAQLATFSGVEQQIRTNDQLERIFEALGGGSSAGLAAWIGREVRAPAKAGFAGLPVEIETTPLAEADRATLVVTNDFGQVVARRAVDPKDATLTWDGQDELGRGLPHGLYSFAIERAKGEEMIGTGPGQVFGTVTEVRIEDDAPMLVLDGGARVPLGEVTALR